MVFLSLQALPGAAAKQLWGPLGGVHRQGGAPGSLPPGVQHSQQHLLLSGWRGGGCQLYARSGLPSGQWPEEEAEGVCKDEQTN